MAKCSLYRLSPFSTLHGNIFRDSARQVPFPNALLNRGYRPNFARVRRQFWRASDLVDDGRSGRQRLPSRGERALLDDLLRRENGGEAFPGGLLHP